MYTFYTRMFIVSFILTALSFTASSPQACAHQTLESQQIQTNGGAPPQLPPQPPPQFPGQIPPQPPAQIPQRAAVPGSSLVYHFAFYSNPAHAFVSARLDTQGAPLKVGASALSTWETFTEIYNADGSVSFQAANGDYVSARVNKPNAPLEAEAIAIGPWEKFNIIYLNKQAPCKAFQAANGNYISARIGTSGVPLEAEAATIGPWEVFTAF